MIHFWAWLCGIPESAAAGRIRVIPGLGSLEYDKYRNYFKAQACTWHFKVIYRDYLKDNTDFR